MRKCIGVFLVFTLLLSFGTTVNAATWGGGVGNWSVAGNWASSTPPVSPSTETVNINSGSATLDIDQQVGIVLLNAAAPGTAILNINTGNNLTIYKSGSSELLSLVKTAAGPGTVYHSAGTVTVGNGAGTGEVRLVNIAGPTGTYNLSGTGILDTEVLSKGNSSRAGVWNATGGTLVARNMIYRFGLISAGYGFNQGDCKLEVGAIDTVAALAVGNSTNTTDYTVDAGGTIVLDIASASSFDTIVQIGNIANTLGAALEIGLLGGYTPTAGATFDVWSSAAKTMAGSGAFASITGGWSAGWVDTDSNLTLDTLRLTYIPEPATIALLGLGLLAIRRNKK